MKLQFFKEKVFFSLKMLMFCPLETKINAIKNAWVKAPMSARMWQIRHAES